MNLEKQTKENVIYHRCKFCGKKFKLQFSLNKHIEESHINVHECKICKKIIEKSTYNEHMYAHENVTDGRIDSKNSFPEHITIHDDGNQIQLSKQDLSSEHLDYFDKDTNSLESNTNFIKTSTNMSYNNMIANSFDQSVNNKNSQCTINIEVSNPGQKENTNCIKTPTNMSYNNMIANNFDQSVNNKNSQCTIVTEVNNPGQKDNTNFIKTPTNMSYNNMIANNFDQSVNNKNSQCTIVIEVNNPGQKDNEAVNSNQSTTQINHVTDNSKLNNCNLDMQEKQISIMDDVMEINDLKGSEKKCVPNKISELDLQTIPCISILNDMELKKVPEEFNNMSIVKESKYFCVKRSLNVEDVSSVTTVLNDGQTSNTNDTYICHICKSSSVDVHLFALHMGRHKECSMHECCVCDQKFLSVILWVKHLKDHQKQVELNLSNFQTHSPMVEPNTIITSNSVNVEHQALELKQFHCKYCNESYSKESLLTEHEKLHNRIENKDIYQKPIETQDSIQIINSSVDPIPTNHKKRKLPCEICGLQFSQRYITNHMKFKHPGQIAESSNSKDGICNIHNVNTIHKHKKIKLSEVTDVNNSDLLVGRNLNNLADEISDDAVTGHVITRSNYKANKTAHKKSHNHFTNEKVQYGQSENLDVIKINKNEGHSSEEIHDLTKLDDSPDHSSNSYLDCSNHLLYTCDVCDTKYSFPLLLILHRNIHQGSKLYLCKICNMSYKLKSNWNKHLESHYFVQVEVKNNQKTNTSKLDNSILKSRIIECKNHCNCEYCNKGYHLLSYGKKYLTLNLSKCDSSQETGSNNWLQNAEQIMQFKICQCCICEKTFYSRTNCKNHLIGVHNLVHEIYLHTTSSTNAIEQKNKLNTKTIVQHNIKSLKTCDIAQYSCKLCKKEFPNNNSLMDHIQLCVRTYNNMSNDRERPYKRKVSFDIHVLNNHDNRKTQKFKKKS